MEQEEGYWLKKLKFQGRDTCFLMQSKNGPCPLLAIANVMLLKGQLQIHTDFSLITHEYLISLIADKLFSLNELVSSTQKQTDTYYQNRNLQLQGAISQLPKLQVGLDVNVKYNSIKSFEYTQECQVFQLLNISLIHGWIASPHSKEIKTINSMSYNQLQMKLVNCQVIKAKQEKSDEEKKIIEQGEIISEFLNISASQLTVEGLNQIHENLQEKEMCVFFRNNHFSTIYKHSGGIYQLATDLGFKYADEVIWQKLTSIDGNNKYYNSNFMSVMNQSPEKPIAENQQDILLNDQQVIDRFINNDLEMKRQQDQDASLALAIALHQDQIERKEEEDRRLHLNLQQAANQQGGYGRQYQHPQGQQNYSREQPAGGYRPVDLNQPQDPQVKKKKKCVIW